MSNEIVKKEMYEVKGRFYYDIGSAQVALKRANLLDALEKDSVFNREMRLTPFIDILNRNKEAIMEYLL